MLAIDNIYKNNFTNTLKDMVLMWEGGLFPRSKLC
jgi:hypothetical protein